MNSSRQHVFGILPSVYFWVLCTSSSALRWREVYCRNPQGEIGKLNLWNSGASLYGLPPSLPPPPAPWLSAAPAGATSPPSSALQPSVTWTAAATAPSVRTSSSIAAPSAAPSGMGFSPPAWPATLLGAPSTTSARIPGTPPPMLTSASWPPGGDPAATTRHSTAGDPSAQPNTPYPSAAQPPPAPAADSDSNPPDPKRPRREALADPALPSWPFTGDWRGITWNSQALFSPDPLRQQRKRRCLAALLASGPDFVFLQELHSTPGSIYTWERPAGYVLFYEHGTAAAAGVGILVSRRFLQHFEQPLSDHLDTIVPGRIAALRLRGPLGSLDLVVTYLSTGAAQAVRERQCQALGSALRPRTETLTLVAGDFNYAAGKHDRVSFGDLSYTGERQSAEHEHFCRATAHAQLFEMDQEDFTHRSSIGTSRLDRVYANYPVSFQLDRRIMCQALAWPDSPLVSTHRPVAFSCTSAPESAQSTVQLQATVLVEPTWKHRVLIHFEHLLAQEVKDPAAAGAPSGLRRLVLFKRTIRHVSQQIQLEIQTTSQQHVSDDGPKDFALYMAFLRAVDRSKWSRARTLAKQLLRLSEFTDVADRGGALEPRLDALRQEVLLMARRLFVEDLRHEQQAEAAGTDHHRQPRRGNVMQRLRRLRPGCSTMLTAVRGTSGATEHTPAGMMESLRQHWRQVFTARAHDEEATRAWLESAYPDREGLEAFPPSTADVWEVRRSDVAAAIRMAGSSAPGPDGIPYGFWQHCGNSATDVLYAAIQDLQSDDAKRLLADAYRDDDAGCAFNAGTLVFLPKKASAEDEHGGPVFLPSDTRPLCIVDTVNRLLASAARLRWEDALAAWLSPEQRGFLPRRSM